MSRPDLNPVAGVTREAVSQIGDSRTRIMHCYGHQRKRKFQDGADVQHCVPRREVQSDKVWEKPQDFAFGRPVLTLLRALSMKWKGQEADIIDWRESRKWRKRRLSEQREEKNVVSRGHVLKGGAFSKTVKQWRDSSITIVRKERACMERMVWDLGGNLRASV